MHQSADWRSAKKETFRWYAELAAQAVGSYLAFLLALLTVSAWMVTGPYFSYSDTWQIFINAGTTVVTFLVVFPHGVSHSKFPKSGIPNCNSKVG
jgi:Low affinity iron permease